MTHKFKMFFAVLVIFRAAPLWAASTGGAPDNLSSSCPVYSAAQSRIDARAKYLLNTFPQAPRVAGGPDFTLALENVIAARAQEEARVWLIGEIANEVCAKNDKTQPYFPNTCNTMGSASNYPGPSLTTLRTQFKRDIFALPACYVSNKYFPGDTASTQPKDDFAIDSYVAEAALVGIYSMVTKDKHADPDTPTLSPTLTEVQLAQILVSASLGPIKSISSAGNGSAPHARTPAAAAPACTVPTDQQIIQLATDVASDITDGVAQQTKSTPEVVIAQIRKDVVAWCPAADLDLKLVSDTYSAAIRGNYSEAALTAANDFLCTKTGVTGTTLNSTVCSRLPLLGDVASATTTADMETALNNAIEPIGAWRLKQSETVWSLDAMAGAALGTESVKANGASASHFTTGLYMPVGVEFSHPLSFLFFRSGAIGLTMLDLGGLVSYSKTSSLAGGQTTSASNAHFSSVTAPGGYLALAFKNSPFRIGISASRTPDLRSVNFSGGTSTGVDSTRIMLFLAVDVTLIAF